MPQRIIALRSVATSLASLAIAFEPEKEWPGPACAGDEPGNLGETGVAVAFVLEAVFEDRDGVGLPLPLPK